MRGLVRSLLVSIWFMFLTFPIMVIKVNPRTSAIMLRWENMLYIGVGIFFASFAWRAFMAKKGLITVKEADIDWFFQLFEPEHRKKTITFGIIGFSCLSVVSLVAVYLFGSAGHFDIFASGLFVVLCFLFVVLCFLLVALFFFSEQQKDLRKRLELHVLTAVQPGRTRSVLLLFFIGLLLPIPFIADTYQVNIFTQAMIWVMLGLGLNIVVGEAGLLVLGYVAFYAVGAYTYAVCNQYFSSDFLGFWICLPLGGFLAILAGVLLSLPVLRLRGDYLAIVTLGFGEIVRMIIAGGSLSVAPILDLLPEDVKTVVPHWMFGTIDLGGPAGIPNIPAPGLFGIPMDREMGTRYIYFIALGLTIVTIIAVNRLRDSRLGRSWMALRDDEIACEAMGINKVYAKLSAFALGACWAGFGGVLFAAKTSFINPSSFTFMESALILSVVVLGGLGSILGVILGACILILLPEYLRFVNEYRMLIFGASMVLMMIFRPQGLITPERIVRKPKGVDRAAESAR